MPSGLRPVLLCVALVAGACAGGERPTLGPAGSAPADDQRLADAAVLVLADLPPGFALEPEEEEDGAAEDEFDRCLGQGSEDVDEGMTADAEGGNFAHGETASFAGSAAFVMKSDDLAHDSLEWFGSDRTRACFRDAFLEELADDPDLPGFKATLEDLAYFEIGDEVEAVRYVLSAEAEGRRLVMAFDVVTVRKDRTVGFYVFGGLDDGYPVEEQVTVINKALARVG